MNNLGINNKVQKALETSGYDAILVAGFDHTRYLSSAELPFAPYRRGQVFLIYWQKGSEPFCICPAEWASTIFATGWPKRVRGYQASGENLSELIASVVEHMKSLKPGARVGYDRERMPARLFNQLRESLPEIQWMACDEWLLNLRKVKTPAEIEQLEKVAYLTDHGINGAIHHVTVDRRTTSLTLAEELRVHTEERGVTLMGYHASSHVTAGKDTQHFWSEPPKFGYSRTEDLHPNEMVRMKIQTCLGIYWADASRIMTMGEPTPAQSETYHMLVTLRDVALAQIKPGARCNQVYQAVREAAEAAGIPLVVEMEIGHGIGVSPSEPPYLTPCDLTPLEAGMTLVLGPVIIDGEGQIWQSKDTVIVTTNGCEIVGWYKDWREPYIPIASI